MIYLGNDHCGFEYKKLLAKYLSEKNIEFKDYGCFSTQPCDYPDIAQKVCSVMAPSCDFGILLCGTGIGMSIAANKFVGIRAAIVTNDEMARMARAHNNANVLCLGAKILSPEEMLKLTDIFLNTEFEFGRHLTRINKLESNRIY